MLHCSCRQLFLNIALVIMSDMITDEEVNWLDCVSAIETKKGVIYFCDNEYFAQRRWNTGPEQHNVVRIQQETKALNLENMTDDIGNKDQDGTDIIDRDHPASEDFKSDIDPESDIGKPLLTPVADFASRFQHGRFMYSITAFNPLDTQQHILDNFRCNQLLIADLCEAFPDGEILNNFSYFPHRPHHFERGYTVILPLHYPKDHAAIIHNIALKYKQAAYFKCQILPDGQNTQTIVLLENYVKEVEESLVVVERLSYHPAYLNRNNNSVFHEFHDALNILSKCHYLPEAGMVIQIAKEYLSLLSVKDGAEGRCHQPVLVVEGTCDAGVSKHSRLLSQAIGGTHLQSPPTCIRYMRKTFDRQNQLVQAAFYTVGNYILASQVREASRDSPVVLDRFWNSTAAFTIISEVGRGVANLPPKEHVVYDWPKDLLKPDAVVLVGSRKSIRNGLYDLEKNKIGKEERVLKQLMFETLRRMKTSSWIEVDHIRDQCHSDEAVTMVTIDKLHQRRIGSFHAEMGDHGLCPGATLHPQKEHDILPVEKRSVHGSKFKSHKAAKRIEARPVTNADIGFL